MKKLLVVLMVVLLFLGACVSALSDGSSPLCEKCHDNPASAYLSCNGSDILYYCPDCAAAVGVGGGSNKFEHRWSKEGDAVGPSCTAASYQRMKCDVCEAVQCVEDGAPLGHLYVGAGVEYNDSTVDAGVKRYLTDATSPADFASDWVGLTRKGQYVKSSCMIAGNAAVYCRRCDSVHEVALAKGEHTWDSDHAVITPSTCIKYGSVMKICLTCGQITTEKLPLGSHIWAINNATGNEWFLEGNMAYKKCSVCGQYQWYAGYPDDLYPVDDVQGKPVGSINTLTDGSSTMSQSKDNSGKKEEKIPAGASGTGTQSDPMGPGDPSAAEGRSASVPERISVQDDLAGLFAINSDLAGMLTVGDVIDIPVAQRDNTYYLSHDFYGEEDDEGTIFIDEANILWPQDRNILFYCCNSKDSTAFGDPETLHDLEYWKKNPIIRFRTVYDPYETLYVPVALFDASSNPDSDGYFDVRHIVFRNEDEFLSFTDECIARSTCKIPFTVERGDHLITLIVCGDDDERFVIVCRALRPDEQDTGIVEEMMLSSMVR